MHDSKTNFQHTVLYPVIRSRHGAIALNSWSTKKNTLNETGVTHLDTVIYKPKNSHVNFTFDREGERERRGGGGFDGRDCGACMSERNFSVHLSSHALYSGEEKKRKKCSHGDQKWIVNFSKNKKQRMIRALHIHIFSGGSCAPCSYICMSKLAWTRSCLPLYTKKLPLCVSYFNFFKFIFMKTHSR